MALSQTELQALEAVPEDRILAEAIPVLKGRIAVISSFGAESAVLLALVARIDQDVPVFFLDTKRHFPETLVYRDRLAAYLGLRNVRQLAPSASALSRRDPQDQLAAFDPDACCDLRKVEPLAEISHEFDVLVTGRKRSQAPTRSGLSLVERVDEGRVKLNPLAGWEPDRIEAAMTAWALPRHPLVSKGYMSIGCVPCTRAVKDGENSRAGRWAGMPKTECGIHRATANGHGS